MKRIFAVCILLLPLAILSCSGPVPEYKRVYIRGKIMRQVTADRAIRDSSVSESKMQSSLIALYRQYIENGKSIYIHEDSLTDGDVLIPSTAKVDIKDKVYVYLYENNNLIGQLATSLNQTVEFAAHDTINHIYQAWVKIDDLLSVASDTALRHMAVITEPLRSQSAPEMVHSAEAIQIAGPLVSSTVVTVGVISDDCGTSEHLFSASQAAGRLGAEPEALVDDAVYRTQEGLAMMEVVHQIAPNARLKFATGTTGLASFHNSIIALANAGCKIIVDDLLYFEEPAFSDGATVGVIDRVGSSHGVIYVTSAGNFSQDVFSFQFSPMPGVNYGHLNSHSPEIGTVHYDAAGYLKKEFQIAAGQLVEFVLQWDDQFGASQNDFDLHLIDIATGMIVTSSTDLQSVAKHGNPFEYIKFEGNPCWGSKGYRIEIVREREDALGDNSTPRMKLMLVGFDNSGEAIKDNSIFGHACGQNVIACAAMPANSLISTVEEYSSRGGAQIVEVMMPTVGGARPLAPSRQKPDLAGVDCIATSVPTYPVFAGTSAAAPVVAGIIALMKASEPTATTDNILTALRSGCIDYDIDGPDFAVGHGRIDAFRSIARLKQNLYSSRYFAMFSSDVPSTSTTPANVLGISSAPTSTISRAYVAVTLDGFMGSDDLIMGISHQSGTLTNAPLYASPGVMISTVNAVFPTTVPGFHQFDGREVNGQWELHSSSSTTPLPVRDFGIFVEY